jgi:hypothetical protein
MTPLMKNGGRQVNAATMAAFRESAQDAQAAMTRLLDHVARLKNQIAAQPDLNRLIQDGSRSDVGANRIDAVRADVGVLAASFRHAADLLVESMQAVEDLLAAAATARASVTESDH